MLCTVHGVTRPTLPSFQWSELARRPADVGAALDLHGEVAVQRGSQALRLGPPETPEITEVFRDLCRLLASLVSADEPAHVTSILEAAWPWTRALPPSDQLLLAVEIGPIAEMCESLGSYRPLLDVIADWRRTARAWADGGASLGALDVADDELVERPAV